VLLRIFGASVMLVVIIERLLRGGWRPAWATSNSRSRRWARPSPPRC